MAPCRWPGRYLAREALRLKASLRIFDPRQIRIARSAMLLAAAATAGLHAIAHGHAWAGLALALGTTAYISITTAIPAITRALDQDESPHHIVVITMDLLIITMIVWLTGGVQSEYYLLFYGPVIYAALHLDFRDGIGATILAALLYFFLVFCEGSDAVVITTAPLRALGVFASAVTIAIFFALIKRESRAYENLRDYLHNSLRRVSAVYDLAHAANAGANVSAVCSMLLDQASRAAGADDGGIALLQEDGSLQTVVVSKSRATPTEERRNYDSQSARQAIVSRKAVIEEKPATSSDVGVPEKTLHLPLLTPGGPIGVFTLSWRMGRKLRQAQVEFLDVLCTEAATAIENVLLRGQLNRLASTDHLTGLSNRREVERMLSIEADRATRYRRPLTVLMLDIDNLKDINDCYGHAMGDQVICILGQILGSLLCSSDRAGRMGGDEFLIVLPETDARGGQRLADQTIREFGVKLKALQDWKEMASQVGLSIGIADSEDGTLQERQLVSQADEALYEAKRAGKNCARVARPRAKLAAARG